MNIWLLLYIPVITQIQQEQKMAELPIQLPEITAPVFAPLPGLTPPALPASIRPINEELDLQEALMRSAQDMEAKMSPTDKTLLALEPERDESAIIPEEDTPEEAVKGMICTGIHPIKKDKNGNGKKIYTYFINGVQFYNDAEVAYVKDELLFKYDKFFFASFKNQDAFFDFMEKIPEGERQFHEVIMDGMPQRMFCDLDGEFELLNATEDVFDERPPVTRESILHEFIKILAECFDQCGQKFNERDLIILSACNARKLSLHLIYDCVFRDWKHQRQFWMFVMQKLEQKPMFHYIKNDKNGVPKMKCVLDMAVYRPNHPMRMAGCIKKEDPTRVLMPIERQFDRKNNVTGVTEKKVDILHPKYLITVPHGKDFWAMTLPKYEPSQESKNEGNVANIVEMKTGCKIKETKGRLFILENPPEGRQCILGKCVHTSNHGYVIWSKTALIYKCHAETCKSDSAIIHQFAMKKVTGAFDEKFGWSDISDTKIWRLSDLHDRFRSTIFRIANAGVFAWGVYGRKSDSVDANEGMMEYQMAPNGQMPYKPGTDQDVFIKIIGKDDEGKETIKDSTIGKELFNVKDNKDIIHKYYGRVFEPYCDVSKTSPDVLNMFIPFKYNHSNLTFDGARVKIILDALRDIVCNKNQDAYEYVVNWLAHLIQKPATKCGTCLILKTSQQQGGMKSLFFDCFMSEVIGKRYHRYMEDCNQINGEFNAMAEMKLMTFIDELPEGVEAKANINKMKAMATAGRQTIRKMRTDAYSYNDCNRIVTTTNHDRMQLLELRDMRWQCIETGVASREYSAKVAEAMGFNSDKKYVDDVGGYSFFHFLKKHDISGWQPTKFAETDLRKEMIMNAMPNHMLYVIELLKKRENGNYERFVSWCKQSGVMPVGSRTFFPAIRKIVPEEWVKVITIDGAKNMGIQVVPPKPTPTDTIETRAEAIVKKMPYPDRIREQIKNYHTQLEAAE